MSDELPKLDAMKEADIVFVISGIPEVRVTVPSRKAIAMCKKLCQNPKHKWRQEKA